jgi:hypothetical protein
MKNGKEAIKIQKGVPIPQLTWASKNPLVLAMAKMKNGDSFLYPVMKRSYLSIAAKRAGIVITTRSVDEANVRVWRIKERPGR